MEELYASVILALGSAFLFLGAGFFTVFGVVVGQMRREGLAVETLGKLMVLPWSALLLGAIAVAFGLQDQTAVVARLCEHWLPFGTVASVAWAVAFASASAYVVALLGKRWARYGRIANLACALSCQVLVVSIALFFVVADVPWNPVACTATVLGLPFIAGGAYSVMICEGLNGFQDAKTVRRVLALCLAVGALLSLGGFIVCFQMALQGETLAALVDAAMSQVTLALVALTAAAVFSLLALRSKDTGYYSTIAFVASFIASLSVLMVLFAA